MNQKCLLIFISIFFSACTYDNRTDFYESKLIKNNLELIKVDEFILNDGIGSGTEKIIGRLRTEFVSNPDNSLYAFYDELNYHFIIADNKGRILKTVSKRGRGPGEIMSVLGFNFDENQNLIVYDGSQLMIKIFDLEKDSFDDVEIDRSKTYVGNKYLYPSAGKIFFPAISSTFDLVNIENNDWTSELVGVFEYNGKLIESFGQYDPHLMDPKSYLIFPLLSIDFDSGQIVSSHPDQFSLQLYNMDTREKMAWFGLKTENFNQTSEYISANLSHQRISELARDLSWTTGVFFHTDYIVSYFVILTEEFQKTRNHNDKQHFVTIYDRTTYDSFGEIEIPYTIGNVIDDKFYLIEDDHPDHYTIGIYELLEYD